MNHQSVISQEKTRRKEEDPWRELGVPKAARPTLFQKVAAYGVSLFMTFYPVAGYSVLPSGADVTHGDVSIGSDGTVMTIDQATAAAIVNWQTFSIGLDNAVNVNQPDAAAAMLSRVIGNDVSDILGALTATGHFYLVNPNGVFFGKDATIDTGALIASTLDMTDSDFLAGRHIFSGDSDASIINEGMISADDFITLIAKQIENAGAIEAAGGTAALAARDSVFEIDSVYGSSISIDISGIDGDAINTGYIDVSADNLPSGDGGAVIVQGNRVGNSGAISANGGGSVSINSTGRAAFLSSSVVEARGGGEIRVNAPDSTGGMGDSTVAYGGASFSTLGGDDDGFIELSGHTLAVDSATIEAGHILFDPVNIDFNNTGDANVGGFGPADFFEAFNDDFGLNSVFKVDGTGVIGTSGVANNNTIEFQAKKDATVTSAFNINTATGGASNVELIITASNDVNVNADITADGSGNITLTADGNVADGVGDVVITGAKVIVVEGAINLSGENVTLTGASVLDSSAATAAANGLITVNANATFSLGSTAAKGIDAGDAGTVINAANADLTSSLIDSDGVFTVNATDRISINTVITANGNVTFGTEDGGSITLSDEVTSSTARIFFDGDRLGNGGKVDMVVNGGTLSSALGTEFRELGNIDLQAPLVASLGNLKITGNVDEITSSTGGLSITVNFGSLDLTGTPIDNTGTDGRGATITVSTSSAALDSISATGNVSITTRSALTIDDPITTNGDTVLIRSDNDITIDVAAGNAIFTGVGVAGAAVVIKGDTEAAGIVTINDDVVATDLIIGTKGDSREISDVVFGTSTLSVTNSVAVDTETNAGTVTLTPISAITVTGNIDFADVGQIVIGGNTTTFTSTTGNFSAGNLFTTAGPARRDGDIRGTGNIVIRAATGVTLHSAGETGDDPASLTVSSGGTGILGGGNFTIDGPVDFSETLNTTVVGDTLFDTTGGGAGGGNINFGEGAANVDTSLTGPAQTLTLTTDTSAIFLDNANLDTITFSGSNLDLAGAVFVDKTFDADAGLGNGDTVNISNTASITSASGNIDFSNENINGLGATADLALSAPLGNVTVAEVGNNGGGLGGEFSASGELISLTGNITALGNVTITEVNLTDDPLNVGQNVTSTAGNIAISGTHNVVVTAVLTANGDITLTADSNNTGGQNLFINAGAQTLAEGTATLQAGTGSNVDINVDPNNTIGGITFGDSTNRVELLADISANGDIDFGSNIVDLNGTDRTINSDINAGDFAHNIDFGSADVVDSGGTSNLDLDAGTGTITFSNVDVDRINIFDAGALSVTSGTMNVDNALLFGNVDAGDNFSVSGTYTILNNSTAINFTAASGGGDLNINGAGTLSIGLVGDRSGTVTLAAVGNIGGGIGGLSVFSDDGIDLTRSVTGSANANITLNNSSAANLDIDSNVTTTGAGRIIFQQTAAGDINIGTGSNVTVSAVNGNVDVVGSGGDVFVGGAATVTTVRTTGTGNVHVTMTGGDFTMGDSATNTITSGHDIFIDPPDNVTVAGGGLQAQDRITIKADIDVGIHGNVISNTDAVSIASDIDSNGTGNITGNAITRGTTVIYQSNDGEINILTNPDNTSGNIDFNNTLAGSSLNLFAAVNADDNIDADGLAGNVNLGAGGGTFTSNSSGEILFSADISGAQPLIINSVGGNVDLNTVGDGANPTLVDVNTATLNLEGANIDTAGNIDLNDVTTSVVLFTDVIMNSTGSPINLTTFVDDDGVVDDRTLDLAAAGGAITLADVDTLTFTSGATVTFAGFSDGNSDITTDTAIDFSGIDGGDTLILGADTNISSGGLITTNENITGNFNLNINTGAGAVTLQGVGTAGNVTSLSVTTGNTLTLNGDIDSEDTGGNSGNIDLSGAVGGITLTDDVIISSDDGAGTGGAVTFGSAINGNAEGFESLTVNVREDDLTLPVIGNVTELEFLIVNSTTADVFLGNNISTSDDGGTFDGNIDFRGVGGGNVTISANVVLDTTGGNADGGEIRFDGVVIDGAAAGTQSLTLTAGDETIFLENVGQTVRLGAITASTSEIINLNGNIATDGTGGGSGNVDFSGATGNVDLLANVTIDTNATAGIVPGDVFLAATSAAGVGNIDGAVILTVDTSASGGGATDAGNITVGRIGSNFPVTDLILTAEATTTGSGGGINIFNDVVATTTVTIDNDGVGAANAPTDTTIPVDVDITATTGNGSISSEGTFTQNPTDSTGISSVNSNVDITSAQGNITIDEIGGNTTTGRVTINSETGNIANSNVGNVSIRANQAVLAAETGIGVATNPIFTSIDVLDAETNTGGIFIVNDQALTIDEIENTITSASGLRVFGVGGGGSIIIVASSPLTVNGNVTNLGGGNVILSASGTTAGDDLTVTGNVTSISTINGNGNVSLFAGDDIILAGNVTISTDDGTGNSDGSGRVTLMAGGNFDFDVVGGTYTLGDGAFNGDITMAAGSTVLSEAGRISLLASGNVLLSTANADSNNSFGSGNILVIADFAGPAGTLSDGSGNIVDNNGGNVNLAGNVATLNAATGIGSAGNIETSLLSVSGNNTTSGNIILFEVDAGGALNVIGATQTTTGNIDIRTGDGNLDVTGNVSTLGATSTIFLVSGSADDDDDDDLNVQAVITAQGGNVTLNAVDGDAIFNASGNIITTDGDIRVTADQSVTQADGSTFRPTGAGGEISVTATNANVTIGFINSGNTGASAVTVSANRGGVFDADGGDGDGNLDIRAAGMGRAVITGNTGIGSTGNIETRVFQIDLVNTNSGNIRITETAAGGALEVVRAQQSGPAAGNIVITTTAGALNIDDIVGNVEITDAAATGADIVLTSGGGSDLRIENTVRVTTQGGTIRLNSSLDIDMDNGTIANADDGLIDVDALGNVELSSLQTANATGNAVTIDAGGRVFDGGNADTDIIANMPGATVTITAVTGIGAGNAIETLIANLDASVTGTGNMRIVEADGIALDDVDTVNGNIVIVSGRSAAGTMIARDVQSLNDRFERFIDLSNLAGNIDLHLVRIGALATATNGDVTLLATNPAGIANINDANGDPTVNVIGNLVSLFADGNIGTVVDFGNSDLGSNSGGDAIEVSANFLEVSILEGGGALHVEEGAGTAGFAFGPAGIVVAAGNAATAVIRAISANIDATAGIVTEAGDNLGIYSGNVLTLPAAGINLGTTGDLRLIGNMDAQEAAMARVIGPLNADDLFFRSGDEGSDTVLLPMVNTIDAALTGVVPSGGNLGIFEIDGIRLNSVTTFDGNIDIAANEDVVLISVISGDFGADQNRDVRIFTFNSGNIEFGDGVTTGLLVADNDATPGTANIDAAGAIVDNEPLLPGNFDDGNVDIIAGNLIIRAATGIGSVTGFGNAIETQITNLEGNTAAGDIFIVDSLGNLNIGGISPNIGIVSSGGGGEVRIAAVASNADINVLEAVSGTDFVQLVASGHLTTIGGGAGNVSTSLFGDVELLAGFTFVDVSPRRPPRATAA